MRSREPRPGRHLRAHRSVVALRHPRTVAGRPAGTRLTAREREIANLLGLGLTNKEIAVRLKISQRTADTHVQNMLNKLDASNRAQIAVLAAATVAPREEHSSPPSVQPVVQSTSTRRRLALALIGLTLCLAFPADHAIQPSSAAARVSEGNGDLVYDAKFDPDGHEFGLRYVLGDTDSSAIRFVNGGIEYSVLKPGGNTGNRPAIDAMPGFFADYQLAVKPDAKVVFWINFSSDDASFYPVHQVVIQTDIEGMQLGYNTGAPGPPLPLGPQVQIDRMLSGRVFTISTYVAPPVYRVYLDGVRVIDVRHDSVRRLQVPTFAIFGEGGVVRMTALRVYRVEGRVP